MYFKLNKEERKRIREKYAKTNKYQKLFPVLRRLLIEGMLSLVCAVVVFVCALIYDLSWWYYFLVVTLILSGILFLTFQCIMRIKEYEKFIKYGKKIK